MPWFSNSAQNLHFSKKGSRQTKKNETLNIKPPRQKTDLTVKDSLQEKEIQSYGTKI